MMIGLSVFELRAGLSQESCSFLLWLPRNFFNPATVTAHCFEAAQVLFENRLFADAVTQAFHLQFQ